MDKPLRLALIGAGMFAKYMHIPNILKMPEYYKLHCVADPIEERAKEIAEKCSA